MAWVLQHAFQVLVKVVLKFTLYRCPRRVVENEYNYFLKSQNL